MNNQERREAGSSSSSADEVLVEQDSVERGRTRRRRGQPARPEIPVDLDELRDLIQLIRENDFTEFELEREGFRVRFRRGGAAGPGEDRPTVSAPAQALEGSTLDSSAFESQAGAATAPAHPGAKAVTAASEDQGLHIIPSPIVGTFYRSPSPNAKAFVKIGSRVEADTVVCIIEAMKLMNEIQAETSGEVVKIYVENGQPVEYGQPLFGIRT